MKSDQVIIDSFTQRLICPRCGGLNLHQGEVVVHSRPREDWEGIKVVVDNGATKTFPEKDNPESRRDSLDIRFTCEGCDMGDVLTIVQHKGDTFVHWKI